MARANLFPSEGVELIDWTRWWIVEILKEMNEGGSTPTVKELVDELNKRLSSEAKFRRRFYLGLARSPETVVDSMTRLGFLEPVDEPGKNLRYKVTVEGRRALKLVKEKEPELEDA